MLDPRNPNTWEALAYWIRDHLPQMRFTLVVEHPTIVTVWFDVADDELGQEMLHTTASVLRDALGAYLCGPMSNAMLPGRPMHFSFGFWNQALIDHAARVFPLPTDLQPGPIIFYGALPPAESWNYLERVYNKTPGDLPRRKP